MGEEGGSVGVWAADTRMTGRYGVNLRPVLGVLLWTAMPHSWAEQRTKFQCFAQTLFLAFDDFVLEFNAQPCLMLMGLAESRPRYS